MNKRTLRYTILSISLLLGISCGLNAHEGEESTTPLYSRVEETEQANLPLVPPAQKDQRLPQIATDTVPFYQGTYIGVDVAGMAASMLGNDTKSIEVQVDVNLKNRFFPVLEIGYAHTESESEYGSFYKSKAPYFRVGLNYKVRYRIPDESHIFLGIRYGFSLYKYDLESIEITDPIWGSSANPNLEDDIWGGSVSFRIQDESTSAHWAELLAGIRVQIWKNFMMAWTLRYKSRFSVKEGNYSKPAFIPGYGANKSSTFGVTYSLIYKLPM